MTETTPRLALPLIAPSQAQKHVTHNEALSRLDDIVQLAVASHLTAAPPASPSAGERHIVAAGATGIFAGHVGEIATFEDGWRFVAPSPGWLAWSEDGGLLLAYHDGSWIDAAALPALAILGVNATADPYNRLVVASASSLFTHEGYDHRMKLNKAAAGATASLIFQTDWSGRAEFGLAGGDDFSIKVSPDGGAWYTALTIDRATGEVSLPNTPGGTGPANNLLVNGSFALNQRGFAGGSLGAGSYGFDRWKAGTAGASLTRASGVLTLASGAIQQVIEPEIFELGAIGGQSLTVSLDHVAGAAITVSAFGADMVLDDVGGRPAATFAIPGGHEGTVTVMLAAPAGSAQLARVKAEIGDTATPYLPRPLPQEEMLAYRYFKKIEGPLHLFLNALASGNYFFNSLLTPVAMRTTPTVLRSLGAHGNLYLGDTANAFAAGLSPTAFRLSVRAGGPGECYAIFESVTLDAEL